MVSIKASSFLGRHVRRELVVDKRRPTRKATTQRKVHPGRQQGAGPGTAKQMESRRQTEVPASRVHCHRASAAQTRSPPRAVIACRMVREDRSSSGVRDEGGRASPLAGSGWALQRTPLSAISITKRTRETRVSKKVAQNSQRLFGPSQNLGWLAR